jgi:hypothetical protein
MGEIIVGLLATMLLPVALIPGYQVWCASEKDEPLTKFFKRSFAIFLYLAGILLLGYILGLD